MRFKIIMIVLICSFLGGYAQTKNEKEWRISISAFPETSRSLIKTVENDVKRIRFYKEKDGDHESYESKFKFKKHWYSVEFDKAGTLEDIEVTIRKNEIQEEAKNQIYVHLKSNFEKYDVIKIQEQYISSNTSNTADFLKRILKERNNIPSNYEIVVAVKSEKVWSILEITFDPMGMFLNQRPVQQDSYEYIMY